MRHAQIPKSVLRVVLAAIGTIAFILLGLLAITRYDNKYITKAVLTQDYLTVVPEKGYCALVDGWELYPDVLLSPDDFFSETQSYYRTWAGEYPNLSLFHDDGNPYGTSTWRLRLKGSGNVTLYLQEPLCSAKVFVNGSCLGGPGKVEPDNYSPLIRDTAYSFILDGETELIIQTTNFSHYYGGIWYPPVIGDSDSISHLIASRMLLYGLLFFSTLTLALFCIVLWRRRRAGSYSVEFYFGLLSLCFALRICYPFLRLFGIPLVRTLYAVEDAASLAGIYFSLHIVFRLILPDTCKRLKKIFTILSLGMCGMVVVVPLFVLPAIPGLALWYGTIISWYKVIMSVFLIGLTVYGFFMGIPYAGIALAAAAANGCSLLYSVLTIGYYEPFIGAYPEEYGAFCMVIAFAVLMVQRSRAMSEENQRLSMHLREEVDEKTDHLQKLLVERGQLIAELGHDMKSPLTSMSNMAQIIRMNNIMLDQDTHDRMLIIEEQCGVLSERLKSIQEIAAHASAPGQMEPLVLNTFLGDLYHSCRPVIELYGPQFIKKIPVRPCRIMANREQLYRAMENVLYNAADFTPPEGKIVLSLTDDGSYAYIRISDTGCGISEKDLPNIFRRSFTTRSGEGGQGLGLAITRAIILEHGGEIEADSAEGKGTTFTIRLPLIR
ncbi:HAMP domain-containing histidine kinase [Blautia schinkii]|nr:HAMP domain-containing histidine kinase [Blautia schinkii]